MNTSRAVLILGFLTAIAFRVSGIKWDSGYHFHPDERMLIMTADKIHFFDQLNPDFFNYGSLPLYVLKGTAQLIDFLFGAQFANYDGMLVVGRMISLTFDLGTMIVLYRLSRLLFKNERVSLWTALFYATCIFAIQNSHFFVVDVFLTFFTLAGVYALLQYMLHRSLSALIATSLLCAAAVTTKFSGVISSGMMMSILIVYECIPLYQSRRHDRIVSVLKMAIAGITFFAGCVLFMPYAFDFHIVPMQIFNSKFINDIRLQTTMNSDPYIFPYTLQYVGTIPYLYYLKNIFLWGAGPLLSFLALVGIGMGLVTWFGRKKQVLFLIVAVVYIPYAVLIGKSAVKFMRYMLPLYPLIALLAGYGISCILTLCTRMRSQATGRVCARVVSLAVVVGAVGWAWGFNAIYRKPSTRITATRWINDTIAAGSILAVEHWDDRVPIFDPGKYRYEEMTLYELPDDERKWSELNKKLSRTDYIVLASNRLYTPLQRLANCRQYKVCYPRTATYYQNLFSGKLPFKLVADFHSYPAWSLGKLHFELQDDRADESFTVYDHPRILIFKKI